MDGVPQSPLEDSILVGGVLYDSLQDPILVSGVLQSLLNNPTEKPLEDPILR